MLIMQCLLSTLVVAWLLGWATTSHENVHEIPINLTRRDDNTGAQIFVLINLINV